MVLILCISASGSALLLCCLIYCRTQYGSSVTYFQDPRASPGSSVVLRCYSVKPSPVEDLKVEWRRNGKALVLYKDGESRAEVQQQEYQDRAHLFTDQIQHGNFSLRLDNLRAEDKGEYTCTVYSKQRSVLSTQITMEKDDERSFMYFKVKVSSAPVVVPPGSSVVLRCYSVTPSPVEDLKLEWRRTDTEALVHRYPDDESPGEEQDGDYQDRAHFFTDQIQHGNFSLRLDNLTAEDQGRYTCRVYSKHRSVLSTKNNVEPGLLDSFLRLHLSLVFCPNMIMVFAFVFWGVSEGSVNESVCCSALYLLRPLLLLWAAPYINAFSGKIKRWILNYSYVAEYVVFSLVAYSALFKTAWQKLLNFAQFDRVVILVMFSVVFLSCLCKIIYLLVTEVGKRSGRIIEIFGVVSDMINEILPTLQFIILFYTFGSSGAGFIIVIILPVFMMMTSDTWLYRCHYRVGCSREVMRTVMIIFTLVMNTVMIGVYITTLEKTTDPIGWGCVLVFLQILWTIMKFTDPYTAYISLSRDFHRFVLMYVSGSVGIVFLTSAALIIELILKTVNGDRTVADLRFIIFPVECFFAVSVLILGMFESKIINCLKSCKEAERSRRLKRSQKKQKREEEAIAMMSPRGQEETQPDSVPDSVLSQT